MYPLACYFCSVLCSNWLAVCCYGVQPLAAKGLILVWCLPTSLMQDSQIGTNTPTSLGPECLLIYVKLGSFSHFSFLHYKVTVT